MRLMVGDFVLNWPRAAILDTSPCFNKMTLVIMKACTTEIG